MNEASIHSEAASASRPATQSRTRGMAGVVGSRVQRSISIESIRSLRSPRICDRATVGKPQRKF
jgi:hypothetical protein